MKERPTPPRVALGLALASVSSWMGSNRSKRVTPGWGSIGTNIQAVRWRWPLGLPLVDGFGAGLYEVRASVDDDIYRVFFCTIQHTKVLLHGFMKKAQQTPKADLDLARKRQKTAKEALS